MGLDGSFTLFSGDVFLQYANAQVVRWLHLRMIKQGEERSVHGVNYLQADDILHGLDRNQINSYEDRLDRHVFGRDLGPRARSGAQVQNNFALGEQVIFFVQLQKLERCT